MLERRSLFNSEDAGALIYMSTNLAKPHIDRLIVARYFYFRGKAVLQENGPFAAGFAICNFQDAAETFLRVVAEHLHCPTQDNTQFSKLIDDIDAKAAERLTHRASLLQLNKARVGFKHYALRPAREDAEKFNGDLEAFFSITARLLLGVEFESVSMVSLIGHARTENWLREAEQWMSRGDATKAVTSAAVAFAIFRRFMRVGDKGAREVDPFRQYRDSELVQLATNTQQALDDLQGQLDLIMNGINLAEYRRFRVISPAITITHGGKVHTDWPQRMRLQLSLDDARRCVNFVLESALKMKDAYVLGESHPRSAYSRKYRVIVDADMVAYPEENPEIIRKAKVGEVIVSCGSKPNYKNYIAVFLPDGDRAYVSADALEELPED